MHRMKHGLLVDSNVKTVSATIQRQRLKLNRYAAVETTLAFLLENNIEV